MSKLGILLACDHYPTVSDKADQIDAQLRYWLAATGTTFDDVEVFAVYDGALPHHAASCEAWIVSGALLPPVFDQNDRGKRLKNFLRAAASFGRPIYAINHAEHVVHDALAAFCASRPETPATPRAIQNPFRSFCARHKLHRFNPATRRVDALDRPEAICPRASFRAFWRAA